MDTVEEVKNKVESPESIEDVKNFWMEKRCPACNDLQKYYELSGIIFINHRLGLESINVAKHYEKMPYPISSLSAVNYFEPLRIVITHTCPRCKFISMWNADSQDVAALISLSKDGIGIKIYTDADVFRDVIKHETTPTRKKAFEAMKNWIDSIEPHVGKE